MLPARALNVLNHHARNPARDISGEEVAQLIEDAVRTTDEKQSKLRGWWLVGTPRVRRDLSRFPKLLNTTPGPEPPSGSTIVGRQEPFEASAVRQITRFCR